MLKRWIQLLAVVASIGFVFSGHTYFAQNGGPPQPDSAQAYSKFVSSPMEFLRQQPSIAPVGDEKIRTAVLKDFLKWTKWIINQEYIPPEKIILQDIQLFRACAATGGVDIASLTFRAGGQQLTIGQSGGEYGTFCLTIHDVSNHNKVTSETAQALLQSVISTYIRADVLEELPSLKLCREGDVLKDTSGWKAKALLYLKSQELCFCIAKSSLRTTIRVAHEPLSDEWFDVVVKKVENRSEDMEDIPRLASDAEIEEYLQKHRAPAPGVDSNARP